MEQNKKAHSFQLPVELMQEYKVYCAVNKVTQAHQLIELIEQLLNKGK